MISAPYSSTAEKRPTAWRGLAAGWPRALLFGVALASAALVLAPVPAAADFRLCNRSSSRVGIALGYKDGNSWSTEGWWNIGANSCETLLRGDLVARFYYVYAIDYDLGGEWSGKAFMCTREKEFTIRGMEDCLARGYDRTGFFEVDTQEQKSWTVQLTEPAQKTAAQQPGGAPVSHPAPPKKP
ncbi:DUF1036 domain-containing protein [Ancylobacter sp. VNQ12]|uniref:DUF1036 domain-containing protein n=1 Tax=Ancylobacter sp. VNQ12 TaxID=3400920 RepID=UPI003C0A5589